MSREVWIMESDGKSGDFSDVASQNTFQVGNLTDAVEAEAKAIEEGAEPIWYNAPVDRSVPYEVESGQTFIIGEFETDSQGVQYQPK